MKVIVLSSALDKVHAENYLGAVVFRCPSSARFAIPIFFMIIKNHSIDKLYILSGADTFVGLLFLVYGKIKRIRTGISLFSVDILSSKSLLKSLLFQIALLLADRIGGNSEVTCKFLPRLYAHKIHVLYPGADPSVLRLQKPPKLTSRKENKVLFVGRLTERKGMDDLLRAFRLVLETVPKSKLIIVGDGTERAKLWNLSKTLGIHDKVEFTGTLVGKELYSKYQDCDVFVMPSKKVKGDPGIEGFGMVFLEAGLFRKPSIGTWHGGIPEAVMHGKTGLLVPEGNVKALAGALESLLTNKDLAERLGQNAYRRVIEEFTWKKATLKLIKMLSEQ